MILHPINKIGQLLLITAVGLMVAFLFGLSAGMPLLYCPIDGVVYAALWMAEGLLLNNILKYSYPKESSIIYRILYVITLGLMVCISILGIECMFCLLISETWFSTFFSNIWERFFVTALLYVIVLLYYDIQFMRMERDQENDTYLSTEKEKPVSESICQIHVKVGQKIKIIHLEEILYLKAEGDYVGICTLDGYYLKEQTMKYYEAQLPSHDFLRIHRSYIVHLDSISKIERYGELQQIELKNGDKIKISAAGYKLLKTQMQL